MGQWINNCQSTKTFWIIYRNKCFEYASYHKTPVEVVNNSKMAKHKSISQCPRQGTDKPDVYDERAKSRSHVDLKSNFALKIIPWNSCLVRLVGKCIIWIASEMDMTPFQVSGCRGKFTPQTRSGTPSTIHKYTMGQLAWRMSCSCAQWLRCYDTICNAVDKVLIKFITT